MELWQHDSEALRAELAKRDEGSPRRNALALALRAAAYSVENPPSGTIGAHQMNKASKLAYELVYQCLPGGTAGGTDKLGNYEAPSGMDAGWLHAFGITPPRGRKFTSRVLEPERNEVLALLQADDPV